MSTPSTPNIDLNPHDLAEVQRILKEYAPQYEVWAFGSRVTWTAKAYSDLDLAIITDKPLSLGTLADLKNAFDESDLSIKVDLVDWATTGDAFREIIKKTAVVLHKGYKKISGEWRETSLDQLGRIITGKTPSSSQSDFYGGNIPFVTPSDFDGRRYIDSTARYLTTDGVKSVRSSLIPAEAIMVSCIGSDMGKTTIAARECVTNQQINSIVVETDDSPLYVYYNLSTRKEEIRTAAGGSAQPILNKTAFGKLDILLPPPSQQRAIAQILGTLDDKIELNRRMNETLEAMARALFKSWFVDFEPVRAKAEGRDTGLPKEIADLFPDSFEDSEQGEVPQGWRLQSFASTVEIIGGGTPKTTVAEYWDGSIPWFSVVDAPDDTDVFVIDTQKKITKSGLEGSSTRLLPEGSTIISARGTVGKVALVGVPMAMNQSCYGLRSLDDSHFFAYFSIRTLIDTLKQRSHGSVFDTITRDTLAGITTVVPPGLIKRGFELKVAPMMQRIKSNLRESSILTTQRDTLLPKLLNGEISVYIGAHDK